MTLIDKDALLEKLSTFHPDYTFNITSFRNFIKAQPEVDAVPVIRCKDCKHWNGEVHDGFYYFEECAVSGLGAISDDYCSRAERKEG